MKVGIAGLGVVGAGVVRLLDEHADVLAARIGRPVKVVAVSARDKRKKRDMPKGGWRWYAKAEELAADPEVEVRSEEHTSELQSLMRISYAVFCLKKKNMIVTHETTNSAK